MIILSEVGRDEEGIEGEEEEEEEEEEEREREALL